MLGSKITTVTDTASPRLALLRLDLTLPKLQARVGPALEDEVRRNYLTLPSNKMGGQSTGFWLQCSDATRWSPASDGVYCVTEKVGARQRYEGGVIRKQDKLLAIPANPLAYGKNPSEFPNLKYIQFGRGQDAPKALIMLGETSTQIAPKRGKKGGFKPVAANLGLIVMFWLKDSVDQGPNVNVLPTNERIFARIDHACEPLTK